MRPPGVSLELGTLPEAPTRISSDFEEISYPPAHWTAYHQEELPLHYMNEEKARRRVIRGPGVAVGDAGDADRYEYDDEGKDVYSKARAVRHGLTTGGGRIRHPPPPPATTIVRVLAVDLHSHSEVHRANLFPKIWSTSHL
jgi:dolichyl-phosphate-mannose-protein mannosyltransferase